MRQVQFTDEELQTLATMLDAAVRHLGAQSVHAISAMLRKLERAEEIPPPSTMPQD